MSPANTLIEGVFRQDVIKGLSSTQKYLLPKYFYDAAGDYLFQQIMHCPEYYLSRAEQEILQTQSREILQTCVLTHASFDLVELGAGDATKTIYLLQEALLMRCSQRYFPIDISSSIINYLEDQLPQQVVGLQISGMSGEYFPMLKQLQARAQHPKLVLFLGATIGNMLPEEALAFCQQMYTMLNPGDYVLIGFDLRKNPQTILDAYNDKAGLTRAFNFNHLQRINRELGADFDPAHFIHFPVYDPMSGSCKSYLVSTRIQKVALGDGTVFHFEKEEAIYMEVSQKYSENEIKKMALAAGYEPIRAFFDAQKSFVDVLWRVPF